MERFLFIVLNISRVKKLKQETVVTCQTGTNENILERAAGWNSEGRPTRVPRASPVQGAPRGRPRAVLGKAITVRGPAQRLLSETSRQRHPAASGRHGDPAPE